MQVKLRVVEGTNAGREIPLVGAEFVVGRGEECHLRPKSEAVSRRHCALVIREGELWLQDFDSKNGTLVNGERVIGALRLEPGDRLTIGPLNFEVVIDYGLGGVKRPLARGVQEVAERTAEGSSGNLDVSSWLEENSSGEPSPQLANPDTRQYRVDETATVLMSTEDTQSDLPSGSVAADEEAGKSGRWKKPEPGKLPQKTQPKAVDSREAAAEMLRRFFNRR